MKTTTMAAAACAALALFSPLAGAGELTDAAVAQALGVSGVTHTIKAKSQRGMAYSDVIYKDGRGGDLIVLRLGTVDQYGLWKQAMGTESTPVSGVGIEAFQVKMFRAVCAKSASNAVCVTPSFVNKNLKISDAQIQALAGAAL
ncbi:hypothetical protein [Ideonella sp.]|uniref:hypothetical protein n=1 Tax=Ideonella sp. TaxID=1929293 RepID=UPI0035B3169A